MKRKSKEAVAAILSTVNIYKEKNLIQVSKEKPVNNACCLMHRHSNFPNIIIYIFTITARRVGDACDWMLASHDVTVAERVIQDKTFRRSSVIILEFVFPTTVQLQLCSATPLARNCSLNIYRRWSKPTCHCGTVLQGWNTNKLTNKQNAAAKFHFHKHIVCMWWINVPERKVMPH